MLDKSGELVGFTGKLAFFIKKGVPVPEIIKNTGDDLKNSKLRDAFHKIAINMEQGASFADSLNLFPSLYPSYITDIIRAGEEQGGLADALHDAASFLYEKERLKNLIKNAFNPILIPTDIAFLIFLFLFLVIFPEFVSWYKGAQLDLPLPAQIILTISDYLQNKLILILCITMFILVNILFFSDYRFKSKWIFSLFPSGNPIRKYYMFFLSKLMSLIVKRGVTPTTAFIQAARGIESKPFGKIADEIIAHLENNEEFFNIVGQVKGIPNHFQWMLTEISKSHSEWQTLDAVAEYYGKDLELYNTKRWKLGGNIYMLVVGAIIFLCIVFLLYPMMPCGCKLQ